MVKTFKLASALGLCALLAGFATPVLAVPVSLNRGAACWIDHGALVASAAFDGIAGDFLIDLSAPASALDETRARLDGVEETAAVGNLLFAGRRLAAVPMTIGDLDARTRGFDTVVIGVLGADVLSRFVVAFDPSPCRIRLIPRASRRTGLGTRLTVDMASGRPLVPARITDGVKIRSGLFALDTAAWPTTLYGDRLSRPAPAAGGPSPARLRAMVLGGRLFEQAPAVVAAAPVGAGARGAIGLSILSRWRMRLDMRQGWLELVPEN